MTKYRQSYGEISQCLEHVDFQLPDERSRVRRLLDSIMTTDTAILAAIANLGLEYRGMIDNLEKVAAHLLMHDPVAKLKSAYGNGNGYNVAHLSYAEVSVSLAASGKVSKGKTGVEIRYYKKSEFNFFLKN